LWGAEVEQSIQQIGNKVFYYQDEQWVDNDLASQTVQNITYGSEEYFSLLATNTENGRFMSLGKNVTFCVDEQCYQIAEGEVVLPEPEETVLFKDLPASHWAVMFIQKMVDLGIISGYADGSFKPNQPITRAEFLKVATGMFSMEDLIEPLPYLGFKDVDQSDWYYTLVSFAQTNNITSGYTDGTFRPNAQITRAEAVKIVLKFLGAEVELTTTYNFSDIKNHWARDFIEMAVRLGIVSGYGDGTFRPDAPITRAEAVKVVGR
jgi:hypothetical protein